MSNLPKCSVNKQNCSAYIDGCCYCLRNTDFKNNVCPFYKNKKDAKKERLKYDGIDNYEYLVKEGVYLDKEVHK